MAGGLLVFGCVATVVRASGFVWPAEGMGTVLLLILAMLAVGETVAYGVVRQATMRNAQRSYETCSTDTERSALILNSFATVVIIGCAMIEGLGLFGVVIYLVSGKGLGLLAGALAVILLAASFPTAHKFHSFESSVTRRVA
jgi:hypothetical protein